MFNVIRFFGVCECYECIKNNSIEQKMFYKIMMRSARHVLYDDIEGQDAEIIFFAQRLCNEEFLTPLGKKVTRKSIRGVKVKKLSNDNLAHTNGDFVLLESFTCDQNLGEILLEWKANNLKIRETNASEEILNADKNCKTCVTISHPHGSVLYISVGQKKGEDQIWNETKVDGDDVWGDGLKRLRHSCTSCPGSSGGLVICGLSTYKTHSGATDEPGIGQTTAW